ncbi:MAG: phosphoribosylformylglycinamidine synthase subunit PurS [Chlorobiaceae bacterium]|jgi:phosphoribosylformylglycinamidine synthase subunit PurS|nr:phosphoribosylformylglycinamidine synthase subunit PurS [Chlorobiaceae bacterium]NTW63411.1 phosphoribosylformylglycinamidine synthase subunit PurS [Chlorobiaceae bacterium]
MPYKAKIKVTLRQSILDVQGKAVEHALKNLGYGSVASARIGKYIEVSIDETERGEAERICCEICEKLLSNPVMENYSFELEPEPVN